MGCFGSKPASTSTTTTPDGPLTSPMIQITHPFSLDPSCSDLTPYITKTRQRAPKHGGWSDVWQGTLTSPREASQTVALKVLRAIDVGAQDANRPEIKKRLDNCLKREILVWKPLKHPRIVSCIGYATVDHLPCLISPWCENGNAQEYIAKHPNCNRKAIIAQVAEGLIYLHSRDHPVVHEDVKLANILVGKTGEAMLTDFGIAKVMDEAHTGFTTTNATASTARCAAPEALDGGERTTQSDVFSFGCVALEVMSGKPPWYYAKNPASIMMARATERIPNSAKFVGLPATDPLWDILNKCWQHDPNSRPPMQEVLHDLQALGYRA